ncbi:MAG TPA: MoaD/ThiS family protein [Eubacteriales bacterium]|mgnify:CR=1 FL=1|jgi:molybdopterin converting factor small subunit|nr:MoaD/ThiS family protein [Clostridia bacterium]HRR89515.1 MoaD/ThiS family protein [Eubacteriales bacterium]HRU84736.1 MoaD/ThiS family protein [Eubacteriales bacterium]
MITVKFFGPLRLDKKIKEHKIESAATVGEVLERLSKELGIQKSELNCCNVFVNNKLANRRARLPEGDVTIMLMSPVAGG